MEGVVVDGIWGLELHGCSVHFFCGGFVVFVTTKFTIFRWRNDICTFILWQHFDNFISHTHIMHLFFLFLFLSLLFLINKKRGKESCHNNCFNWMFKYHYSFRCVFSLSDRGKMKVLPYWDELCHMKNNMQKGE